MKPVPDHSSTARLVTVQIVLATLAWMALVYLPQAGSPILLIPFDRSGETAIADLISQSDTRIISRGAPAGSLVVMGGDLDFAQAILDHRLLALNANAPGCIASNTIRGGTA